MISWMAIPRLDDAHSWLHLSFHIVCFHILHIVLELNGSNAIFHFGCILRAQLQTLNLRMNDDERAFKDC